MLDPMSQATIDQQMVQWKSLDVAPGATAQAEESPLLADEAPADEAVEESPAVEEDTE
jgi:hypothetical protein